MPILSRLIDKYLPKEGNTKYVMMYPFLHIVGCERWYEQKNEQVYYKYGHSTDH